MPQNCLDYWDKHSFNQYERARTLLRYLLRHDLDYAVKILNESRGIDRFTWVWGTKRIIKKILRFCIPGFHTIEEQIYFKYHKFRIRHCIELYANKFFRKTIYISFQSGFGDMLQTYPYFRKIKELHPKHKVVAVLHSSTKCRHPEMSFCKDSLVTTVNGQKIDYVREFLETNPNIDEIVSDDCWGDGYLYGFPTVLKREFGDSFNKESFQKDLCHLFSPSDIVSAEAFQKANGLNEGGPVLAMHLKTSKGQLEEILNLAVLDSDLQKAQLKIILFGSVDPSRLQGIAGGIKIIDLSRSYEKGINTRQLIYIASKSSCFVGGRGGFNAIYYLIGIPTVNIFDLQGKQEIESGIWPSHLWSNNAMGRIFWENEDPSIIFKDYVKPTLLKHRTNSAHLLQDPWKS